MNLADPPPFRNDADTPTQAEARRVMDAVVKSRTAVRAFLPRPVPRSMVMDILDVARFAPSNSNTQPWFVHALQGDAKQRLTEALMRSHESDELPASRHFPSDLPPSCKDRQADFGTRYYRTLGIDRDDATGRYRQTGRNYRFFDAPVGLIFSIDSRLTRHSWLDFGLFLQTLMLAARSRGLDTCPQVSFVRHEPVILDALQLPAGRTIACGMSMGYAAPDAALNRLDMPRAAVDEFASFLGFDEG
ncbi:nitroreductase [Variovorax sp. KK3]|uniref:nitroreductase n=1 Tax=Variovorax sp. KK3 TaxID=1855728 RepID=UPI0009FA5782|nr:nitroreductase [Variovorax sp. KK3]